MNQEMHTLKCNTCGESNFIKIDDTTYECKVCGTTFFSVDTTISQQLNDAFTSREIFDFERADSIYKKILENTNDEKTKVMCYFGRLLCTFGVSYIKDFDGRMVVSISNYNPEYESIKESDYYHKIMESQYSELYKERLDELNNEYKRIKEELAKGNVYDVFICCKISQRTKQNPLLEGRTEESNEAIKLYHALKERGLSVFYSDVALSWIDYDAQVSSALMRSKKILVISSKKEFLESPWVQSEWRRWINFIEKGKKEKSSFYLYIPKNCHFDLPVILDNVHKVQKFDDSFTLVTNIAK